MQQHLRQPSQSVWAPGLVVDVHRGPATLEREAKSSLAKGARKSDRWDPTVTQINEEVRIFKSEIKTEIEEDVSLTFRRGGQQLTSTVANFRPKPRRGIAALAKKTESVQKDSSAASVQSKANDGQAIPAKAAPPSMMDQLSSLLTDMDARLGAKRDTHGALEASQGRASKGEALKPTVEGADYASLRMEKHIQNLSSQAEASRLKTVSEFANNPKTTIWPKVAGSVYSESLFTAYDLPESNSSVFVYQDRKKRVDELPGNGFGDEADSGDGKSSKPPGSGDDDVAMNILRSIGDLPFDPIPPRPFSVAGVPPSPGTSTIPAIEDLASISGEVFPRPLAPGAVETVEVKQGPAWSLDSSIFAPRPKQNDSKGFYGA